MWAVLEIRAYSSVSSVSTCTTACTVNNITVQRPPSTATDLDKC